MKAFFALWYLFFLVTNIGLGVLVTYNLLSSTNQPAFVWYVWYTSIVSLFFAFFSVLIFKCCKD